MNRFICCMLILFLTACAPSGATATSTPAPPPAAATVESASPVASPSPRPTPARPDLPAPLYVLERGQIARIERDGTRSLVTEERTEITGVPPIAAFAVGPSNMLAYVVGDLSADRLVLIKGRGGEATILYSVAGHELSDLVFTPDGSALMLRLLNNNQTPDWPSGLYRLPVGGGAPELLRADDPVDDVVNPSRAISAYLPVAFSPDGSRLLVRVQSLFYEDCSVGVMSADGSSVLRVALPEGVGGYCGEESWTPDGRAVLFLAGPREGPQAGPQLWRADAQTGAAELLLGGEVYARAPLGLENGAIRFYLARVERDAAGAVVGGSFAPAELAGPGAAPQELGPAFSDRLERALWAPNGVGAVIEVGTTTGNELRWVPLQGDPLILPSTRDRVGGLAWGAAEPHARLIVLTVAKRSAP